MQELLTGLFELIFVSFTLIMVFDFIVGLNHLISPVRPQNAQDAAPNTNAMPTADTRNATIAASAPVSQDKKAMLVAVCSSNIVPTTSPERLVMLPDPWMLPIDEQVIPPSKSQQSVKFKPLLLLPPARPKLDVSALKKYVLHGKSVVRVEDIAIELPNRLKQYKLRGQSVLHLADLEAAIA